MTTAETIYVPTRAARFTWPATLGLHLLPAAATFVAVLLLGPVMGAVGLPRTFAVTLAFLLVLTPVELGVLLRAAKRVTGRASLRALPSVLEYRRPIGKAWWLVLPLFVVAFAVAVVLTPVGDRLAGWLPSLFPSWLLPDYDATSGFPTMVLVVTSLVTLAVDGIINPTVEEMYFRGYLLARLPVAGWTRVPLSAALFAMQHYWQPYNWLLIFVLQLILTALVVRLRCFRLGIVMHVLSNSFGIIVGLLSVLTA